MGRIAEQGLTEKQERLYRFIRRSFEDQGLSPRYVDMQKHMKSSIGSVQGLLHALIKKGYVKSGKGKYRGIVPLK